MEGAQVRVVRIASTHLPQADLLSSADLPLPQAELRSTVIIFRQSFPGITTK
jgi:hypothetical protein